MRALPVVRALTVGFGVVALSPAAVFVLQAGESLGGIMFVVLILLDALALAALVWGLRSFSGAALLGALAGSPWVYYFGPESGPWAYLVAAPEYLLLAGVGWVGFRRERARRPLDWLGALAPTLLIIYGVLAPFVRGAGM